MKTIPDESIIPIILGTHDYLYDKGLTKREIFAAMAMQGIVTHENSSPETAANFAVLCADCLIEELNKVEI